MSNMKKIGFIINPVAGMGGKVGLKGTDFKVEEAVKLGAKEISEHRALEFLEHVSYSIEFFTCSGKMGENALKFKNLKYHIVYFAGQNTDKTDTIAAVKELLKLNVDLIIFVGGDGTARDIASECKDTPILGIPSGVKMYSGVFANRPKEAAEILKKFLEDEADRIEAEILDIDEQAYSENNLKIKFYRTVNTIYIPDLMQQSKAEYYGVDEEESKQGIAEYLYDTMSSDTLYLIGAGTTAKKILELYNLSGTLLGIDAIYNRELVGKDLNEKKILELIKNYSNKKIILSPIGNQGFILGRGNLQISEKVLERFEKKDLIIVATEQKIMNLKFLKIDTGSEKIDNKFKGYYKIIVGFQKMKVLKLI
ncbi:MAG: ATP-NAD kinase family protein [Thermoplasmata archaeon]